MLCEGGGTGRRARLRCVWFILGGSSPLPRTINPRYMFVYLGFIFIRGDSNSNDDLCQRQKQGGVVRTAF